MPRESLIDTPAGRMTRKQASIHFDIPLGTLIRRVWLGWSMERIFASCARRERITVMHEGALRLLTDLAPYNSKLYNRVRYRCKQGWPDELLFVPVINAQVPTMLPSPWGVLSVSALARKVGVSPKALETRLRSWSYQDALNTPCYGVRGTHFVMPPNEFTMRLYQTRKRYGYINETDGRPAHPSGLRNVQRNRSDEGGRGCIRTPSVNGCPAG